MVSNNNSDNGPNSPYNGSGSRANNLDNSENNNLGKSHEVSATLVIDSDNNVNTPDCTSQPHNHSGFPINVSSRFQYIKKLGRGGAGLVYQAYDKRLQRHVALKFLINANPSNYPRLVAEARAQAKVEHPYLCPIYEVIEEQGTEQQGAIYLVMQFIEGDSLQQMSGTLALEQLLVLIAKSAQALHHAHSQGLVHGDIKPANIMISSASDVLEPVIVDFGLAWSKPLKNTPNTASKLTSQPSSGTPGFIAPERLTNQIIQLDRRSDIFALGATLFYCLCQQVLNIDEVKNKVYQSKLMSLPTDVQIIISKCLAYDPALRYASAAQLAIDIKLYLTGEPIKSRPGKTYWLQRKLTKYKWLVAAASFALASILVLGAYQLYQQQLHTLREQALVKYNAQIKALEYQTQLTYMAPRHNIESQYTQWRGQIASLKHSLSDMPLPLQGLAQYAIGRMYSVLGEQELAITHLKTAFATDQRSEIAIHLALAYGKKYNKELDALRAQAKGKVKTARIKALEKRYRDPAIELLEQYIDSNTQSSYIKAQFAFFQKDWSQANSQLDSAEDLPAWYYHDDMLKGDISLAKAVEQFEAGAQYNKTIKLINIAEQHYTKALEIAPSAPDAALKPLLLNRFKANVTYQAGQPIKDSLIQTFKHSIEHAKQINSQMAQSHQLFGEFLQITAMSKHHLSGATSDNFKQAEQQLLRAVELAPSSNNAWRVLSHLYIDWMQFKKESGLNNQTTLSLAIYALEQITEQGRDYYYYNEKATLLRNKAQSLKQAGQNSNPVFDQAIETYIEANRRFPEHIGSLINAASTIQLKSNSASTESQLIYLARASALLEKVLQKEPKHFVANYYLAILLKDKVKMQVFGDINEQDVFTPAKAQLAKLNSINSTHPYVRNLALTVRHFELQHSFAQNLAWHSEFEQLLAKREQLLNDFPNNAIILRNMVGVLSELIELRAHLNLPLQAYTDQLDSILNNHANFENNMAFKALNELYKLKEKAKEKSEADNTIQNAELISKYGLRDKSTYVYHRALAVVLLERAESMSDIDEAIQLLNDNKGLPPVLKKLNLEQANAKKQTLLML